MSSNQGSPVTNMKYGSNTSNSTGSSNPFRISSDHNQQPQLQQQGNTQILPKVRRGKDDNLSRSNSINNSNAVPATPRMLRHASNSNNSSVNNSMVLMTDDYVVHPDYQSQLQKSSTQHYGHSHTNSQNRTHSNSIPRNQQEQQQQQGDANALLPGLDLRTPSSNSKRATSNYAPSYNNHTPTPSINKQHNLSRSNSDARRIQQQQQPHPQTPPKQQQQQPSQVPTQQSQNPKEFQQFHRKYIGDWEFAKTIGAGSMGKVKLARHRITNEYCAVKVVPRAARVWQRQHMNDAPTSDQNEIAKRKKEYEKEVGKDNRTIREGALGRILYHPSICRLYEMFSMSNHYYMLFEYVSGGQMLDYIVAHGSLKEKNARKFCRGIASALDYCHSNNIVHRDLKIENIMISNQGEIKIIDFGLSNLFDKRNLLNTYCGSLYFAAPELLSAHPYIGPEVDVWSFGVVLYVLVCGKVPFDDQSVSALHEKIKRGNVEYPNTISKDCVSLLSRMLVVDPSKRAKLKEVMNHPWMTKGFEAPPSNHLPYRVPLQLPLNPEVLKTIVDFELSHNEEQLTNELTDIISSSTYQSATKNWYKLHNMGSPTNRNENNHFLFSSSSTHPGYDETIPDPTIAYHPLISIYYLVDEMQKRNKLKEESKRARARQLQEQQRQPQPDTAVSSQQQQPQQPKYTAPPQRIVTQPVPSEYIHKDQSPLTPVPPVLTFPQAAYKSPHQQSNAIAATNLNDNIDQTPAVTSPRLHATQTGMLETDEYMMDPQQQQQQSASTSHNQQGFNLFRRFSSKKNKTESTGSGSPQPESLPPVQIDSNVLIADESDSNVLQIDRLRGNSNNNNQTDHLVRRVGSMKITSREKQQLDLPPLPLTSKQQIQRIQQEHLQQQQRTKNQSGPRHHRAASAYTASSFNADSNNEEYPPVPQTQLQEYKRQQQRQQLQQQQSQQPQQQQAQLSSLQSAVDSNKKLHPSARAKSVGHTRKQSLNLGSSMENDVKKNKLPPVPSNLYHPDDGFFDDVDIDNATFDSSEYNRSNSANQVSNVVVKRLTNDEIMSQFETAPPGTMPSIEYPRTLFLKGFFSVQTTSTKPLPIIRYDIITLLPKLGVKFTEVKGGFVCMSYPTVSTTSDNNEKIEAVTTDSSATGTQDLGKLLDDTESKAETLVVDNASENVNNQVSAEGNNTASNISETVDRNAVITAGEQLSQQTTKRTSLSSNSSSSNSNRMEELQFQGSPAERATSQFSNTSTPSKSQSQGHRRKFSIGNGLLGYRKKQDKLSISTSVGSNTEQINMPTTPAPANYMRRGSLGIDDELDIVSSRNREDNEQLESSESMNSFHVHENDSDILISSRVEQQNKPIKSPSFTSQQFDNNGLGISSLSSPLPSVKKVHSYVSKNPLKFEIHIVKVPLIGIYGIQFKKLSGNTWLYKSLASEILNRLNL